MKFLAIGLLLLGGCTDVLMDLKGVTYDDAVRATELNHARRFMGRDLCWQLVMEDVAMYRRQAILAAEDERFDDASNYRKKAAEILNQNFPALVTVQALRQADAKTLDEIGFENLNCLKGKTND